MTFRSVLALIVIELLGQLLPYLVCLKFKVGQSMCDLEIDLGQRSMSSVPYL